MSDHPSSTIVHELTTVPNLSTHTVSFRFSVPRDENQKPVKVRVHDVAGRSIKTILDACNTSGIYKLQWDGNDTDDIPVRPVRISLRR
ncbi:hypothetical protein JXB22_06525 [candidate division WOR-3 bacterium]|nr:hypothetical protein [candidate division WOR-3 bacterium]